MEKYILIKELPDASVGTEVIWDEPANAFYYQKGCFISPYSRNYLSAGQVTQNQEYFCKAVEYPEYFAYNNPVYSREEILKLLNGVFPNKIVDFLSVSPQLKRFEDALRELGKIKAEKILNKKNH
jgi:hypothetical protein